MLALLALAQLLWPATAQAQGKLEVLLPPSSHVDARFVTLRLTPEAGDQEPITAGFRGQLRIVVPVARAGAYRLEAFDLSGTPLESRRVMLDPDAEGSVERIGEPWLVTRLIDAHGQPLADWPIRVLRGPRSRGEPGFLAEDPPSLRSGPNGELTVLWAEPGAYRVELLIQPGERIQSELFGRQQRRPVLQLPCVPLHASVLTPAGEPYPILQPAGTGQVRALLAVERPDGTWSSTRSLPFARGRDGKSTSLRWMGRPGERHQLALVHGNRAQTLALFEISPEAPVEPNPPRPLQLSTSSNPQAITLLPQVAGKRIEHPIAYSIITAEGRIQLARLVETDRAARIQLPPGSYDVRAKCFKCKPVLTAESSFVVIPGEDTFVPLTFGPE